MFRKYPSLFLLNSIICGVVVADLMRPPGWILLFLTVIFGLAVIWLRKSNNRPFLIGLIFLTILFSTSLYYNLRYIEVGPNHIAQIADRSQTYHIYGSLTDWPRIKYDRTEIKLAVDSLGVDNRMFASEGEVLIKLTDTTTVLQRGDRLEFYARIYPVVSSGKAAGFDYQRYLNHKNVFGIIYLPTLLNVRVDQSSRNALFAVVDDLREYIKDCFSHTLSKNSAAMAAGFLIGETRDIPVELYQAFRQSGTLHLLAVSGSNVALVVLFVLVLLRPLNLERKRRSLILLVVIFVFALLSYNEPSVLRASVMAALLIGGTFLERRVDLNNIIAVAAVIILIGEPSQLFDVGFQLSFVIAWSLIFILPKLVHLFDRYKNRNWYRWIVFPLLVSLVAQIFSTGIIALYFGKVPLISPLANLVVVPLVSLAVIAEMILLGLYTILPALGQLFGSPVEIVFRLVERFVTLFGSDAIPSLSFNQLSVIPVLVFYIFLVIAGFALTNKKLRRVVLVSGLILINLVIGIKIYDHFFNGQNKIYLANIPGGIAAVVEQADTGQHDLIITSASARKYNLDEKIFEPFLLRHNVEKLSRIFLLSGDFLAYDDVIRLADKYNTDTIIVWPQFEAGFNDALNLYSTNHQPDLVTAYPTLFQPETKKMGYFFKSRGLMLKSKTGTVYFTDDYQASDSYAYSSDLVIGRLWNLDFDELKQLSLDIPGNIYCSKIEQTIGDNLSETEKLDYHLKNVVDLYDYQEVSVSF